ncbi:hypothetical protein VTN00DRAFT_9893 [Thermoascus crustaceus]|uniref:uncharacterized protein n=1 Tax=Thermoascus crustaceus TaxID=5088 RepID=UPI00374390AD
MRQRLSETIRLESTGSDHLRHHGGDVTSRKALGPTNQNVGARSAAVANRDVQNLADLPATARRTNQDAASGDFPIEPALAPHRGRRERGT